MKKFGPLLEKFSLGTVSSLWLLFASLKPFATLNNVLAFLKIGLTSFTTGIVWLIIF